MTKSGDTKREEKPEEPLGIVTEIAAIIFFVSFTDFFPFISKHGIDITDMLLHLCGHPLAFFGKQFFLTSSLKKYVFHNWLINNILYFRVT